MPLSHFVGRGRVRFIRLHLCSYHGCILSSVSPYYYGRTGASNFVYNNAYIVASICNKFIKAYSSGYANILKAFFTLLDVGRSCIDVIRVYCSVLGYSRTNIKSLLGKSFF
jgi:hypothetical protein